MDIGFVLKIAAIGIVTALLSQLLSRAGREEQAFLTTLAGVVVVLALIIANSEELIDTLRSLLRF